MRTWQIVGLAVGLLVASVLVVLATTLFVLPGDTFEPQRDAIEGIAEEDEGAGGGGDTESADTEAAA